MKAEKEEREKHMIYVMSDIHGEYDKFKEVLKQINLQKEDLLYVLGDVVDRGPHPMEILLKMMEMPNVIPIAGNHELMALKCLRFLNQEITDESLTLHCVKVSTDKQSVQRLLRLLFRTER